MGRENILRSCSARAGLGHKGLPRELFDMAQYHLDITSKGVSLETYTAIGAVPAVISAHTERMKGQK